MIKNLTRPLVVLLLAVASLLAPVTAQAATSSYWYASTQTTTPTVFYTNTLYAGADLKASTTVPTGALITGVSYNYKMLDPVPTGMSLNVFLCIGAGTGTSQCTKVNTSSTAQQGFGSTSAFNGLSANQPFRYAISLSYATTKSLSPNYYYSSAYSVQANYTY